MNKIFQRAIFFTKVPLGGYYRYKDVFQIFPSDMKGQPYSTFQKHYANILELWITEDEKIPLRPELQGIHDELKESFEISGAVYVKQDLIFELLSTFTNNLFFRYRSTEDGNWGIPMTTDNIDELKNEHVSSKWCLKWFHFPELPDQWKISEFTKMDYPEIEKVDFKEYYTNDPNLDFRNKENLKMPNTIDYLFDIYYELPVAEKKVFDSAVSFTVSAIELIDTRKTLSLLSSFTAMETMVNLEFKDVQPEICSSCGQSKYGIARKFREFLLKYIGASVSNKKKFNSYYSLRSKIVHTGQQLKTELLFSNVSEEIEEDEIQTRLNIFQLGKIAIANWLLHRKRSEIIKSLSDES